jgi:hypothetical protein
MTKDEFMDLCIEDDHYWVSKTNMVTGKADFKICCDIGGNAYWLAESSICPYTLATDTQTTIKSIRRTSKSFG